MGSTATRDRVRGKTLRFSFTEGPTKGKTYEHAFHDDGFVTYRDAGQKAEGQPAGERAKYGAFEVAEDVQLVSYLSPSGFTLTLALNFRTDEIVGFASNETQWLPVKGRLAG
jgi:hypothetical protein